MANATKKTQQWVMPDWMEPYRELIINTGGNLVEEMVNGNADPLINLPLSTLQACVKSQVGLLGILHKRGLLPDTGALTIKEATLSERERCAQLAEDYTEGLRNGGAINACRSIAKAIRAK